MEEKDHLLGRKSEACVLFTMVIGSQMDKKSVHNCNKNSDEGEDFQPENKFLVRMSIK